MAKISKKQALNTILLGKQNEIDALIPICEDVCFFKPGELIYFKDEPLDEIYIILKGEVRCHNSNNLSDDELIDVLKNGDVLGYIEYLANIDYVTATVDAYTDSYLYRIGLAEFDEIIKKDALLLYRVLINVGVQAHISMQRAEKYMTLNHADLLGEFLLSHANNTLPYECEFTRQQLSKLLHINLRTLYRYVDKLKDGNYIITRKGKIIIDKERYKNLSKRYSRFKTRR